MLHESSHQISDSTVRCVPASPATEPQGPHFDRIPAELRALPQWLCWRREGRNGQTTKVPYSAKTGSLAKSNDPVTWCDFETTIAAYHRADYSGIGFAFQAGDGLVGLDLDHVIDPATGEVDPRALEILERFQGTYCEVSPSGTGFRIFAYGRPGRPGKNEGRVKWLEVYDHTSPRYLTATGNHWQGTATSVTAQQDALDWLHAAYFTKPPTTKPAASPATTDLYLSDAELLDKALSARNGDLFRRLLSGDTSAHGGDDSAADLALCSLLAFWTQRDAGRIDRLFRQSGLMRDKWNRDGYRQRTIDKAIAECQEVYTGSSRMRVNGYATELEYAPARPAGASTDVSSDRLEIELQTIINKNLDNDLALERALKEFSRQQALPIAVVRKKAMEIARLQKACRQGGSKTDGDPPAKKSKVAFKVTTKGRPQAIVYNVLQVLKNDPRWQGVLGYDEFAECAMLLKRPPYTQGTGEWKPRPLEDHDDIETASWLQGEFDLPVSSGIAAEGVQVAARHNHYHPVRDYLDSLKWDGTPRIDALLNNCFGADDSEYTKAVSAKTLISAVARIYRPGCKVDTVLILDGPQGYLKSTAWRILAGDEWFTDHMPDLHSKDAMQQLAGKWIIELAELSALSRSDIESTKRFLSSRQDDFRPAYGRRKVSLPRQCIFVGTTNETCYLKDATGNRRFWPVSITKRCDIATLKKERDQLWGEAVHRFRQGERWHLTGEIEQQATAEQQARIEPDEWEAPIMKYLNERPDILFITSGEILENVLGIEAKDWVTVSQKRVSSILKSHGWKHFGKRVNGVKTKGFLRPIPQPPTPDGTDGTGKNHSGTGTESTKTAENCNKNNGGTDGTDGTGTYIDTQQLNAIESHTTHCDHIPTPPHNSPLRFMKPTGTASTTGSTPQVIDPVSGFGVPLGTGTGSSTSTGTGSTTGTEEVQSDINDGYNDSFSAEYDGFEPVLCDTDEPSVTTRDNDYLDFSDSVPVNAPTAVTKPLQPSCRDCRRFAKEARTCHALGCYMDPFLDPGCGGKKFEPEESLA